MKNDATHGTETSVRKSTKTALSIDSPKQSVAGPWKCQFTSKVEGKEANRGPSAYRQWLRKKNRVCTKMTREQNQLRVRAGMSALNPMHKKEPASIRLLRG